MSEKYCPGCNKNLPTSQFWFDVSRGDSLQSYCISCRKSGLAKWRKENPDKLAAYHKHGNLRKFGLTLVRFNAMLVEQDHCCACCHDRFDIKNVPHVDHEHIKDYFKLPTRIRANYVRGLICSSCNRTIGHAKEDLVRLHFAVVYLEAYLERTAKPALHVIK